MVKADWTSADRQVVQDIRPSGLKLVSFLSHSGSACACVYVVCSFLGI